MTGRDTRKGAFGEAAREFTSREAAAAISRERETRHWTIAQRREGLGENWPSESARITREADEAVDWYMEALAMLRGAWNEHFKGCTAPLAGGVTIEQVTAWMNAPSDTASA